VAASESATHVIVIVVAGSSVHDSIMRLKEDFACTESGRVRSRNTRNKVDAFFADFITHLIFVNE